MARKHDDSGPPTYLKRTVCEVAFQMVTDKDYSAYDLYDHIKKQKGTVINSPTDIVKEDGTTLLHEMVDRGRFSMFIVVMVFGWWTPLYKMRTGKTAGEHSNLTPVQIANKKRTRKPGEELEHYKLWEDSLTPLMRACRSGDFAKARSLIQNTGDLQETFLTDRNGWTALHWAVVNGNKQLVDLLLQSGVDPSRKSTKNETILHIACFFGQSDLLETLVVDKKCQLDPHVEDVNNKSPYDRVAENGHLDSLKELIRCGHQPNETFLVLAAYAGRERCVEYCIGQLNMDINGTDVYGRTALHRACESKKDKIVRLEFDFVLFFFDTKQ